jgi:hypothetical protein
MERGQYQISVLAPFEFLSGPFYFSANSSIVGGKIPYQSNSQTRSCARGISSLLTAAKPGAGSPVACSTTKEAIAGAIPVTLCLR